MITRRQNARTDRGALKRVREFHSRLLLQSEEPLVSFDESGGFALLADLADQRGVESLSGRCSAGAGPVAPGGHRFDHCLGRHWRSGFGQDLHSGIKLAQFSIGPRCLWRLGWGCGLRGCSGLGTLWCGDLLGGLGCGFLRGHGGISFGQGRTGKGLDQHGWGPGSFVITARSERADRAVRGSELDLLLGLVDPDSSPAFVHHQ